MSQDRAARGARPAQAGMSLVELMVGIAIGLFLVTVMGSIYIGSKSTFNSQETVSRLQENSRFTFDTMSEDLRMSAFRGCASPTSGTTAFKNTLQSPTSTPYNFARYVYGSHDAGSGWSPSLDSAISALSPKNAGDVVTIYRPFGSSWSLTAEMSSGTSALTVSPTANITGGDILMVADCAGSAVFQATNATPGASGTIQHATGGGYSPGLSTNDLGRAWLQDATVYRMQAVTYYLADSATVTGSLSLWRRATPGYGQSTGPVELVSGVEHMVVTYGVDTNGDLAADKFVTADAVADWSQVVSARVELLLVGPDGNATSTPQPYTFNGVTTTPTDRRMRTVVSLVSSLRNTVP